MHPQDLIHAFQLSSQQIARFSGLNLSEDAAHLTHAETLLPFTQEPGAHVERTYIRRGEAPLRIYKNDYDKQPPSPLPNLHCVYTTPRQEPLAAKDTYSGVEKVPSVKGKASK